MHKDVAPDGSVVQDNFHTVQQMGQGREKEVLFVNVELYSCQYYNRTVRFFFFNLSLLDHVCLYFFNSVEG